MYIYICIYKYYIISADPACSRGSAPGNKTRVCHRQLLLLATAVLVPGGAFGQQQQQVS